LIYVYSHCNVNYPGLVLENMKLDADHFEVLAPSDVNHSHINKLIST